MSAEPARLSTLSGPAPPPATWDELVRRIGETPLVPVRARMGRREWTLLLKLESHNPFGSIKDRTAYSLIRALEIENAVEGRLTVVESTSGNLGLALAAMCQLRGHRFMAVVDPKVSDHSVGVMRRLGARIEMATRADATGNYLAGRIARVREICASEPNVHWSNQYARSANPRVHYLQTGPEILRQTEGDLDCVFVAVSTGGTLAGIGAYLRSASPLTQMIGVDARGSVALGGRAGPRWLTGIGASRRSDFVRAGHLDGTRWVEDAEAMAVCRKLSDEAGLRLGGSSGAVVAACLGHLAEHPLIRRPVCVCPDDGDKYRESLYDDAWVRGRGIDLDGALTRLELRGVRFEPATVA